VAHNINKGRVISYGKKIPRFDYASTKHFINIFVKSLIKIYSLKKINSKNYLIVNFKLKGIAQSNGKVEIKSSKK
jgi:hypothetical protein